MSAQYHYESNHMSPNNYKTPSQAYQYKCEGSCSCLPNYPVNKVQQLLEPYKKDTKTPLFLKPWTNSFPFQNTNYCMGLGAGRGRICENSNPYQNKNPLCNQVGFIQDWAYTNGLCNNPPNGSPPPSAPRA